MYISHSHIPPHDELLFCCCYKGVSFCFWGGLRREEKNICKKGEVNLILLTNITQPACETPSQKDVNDIPASTAFNDFLSSACSN